MAKVRASASQNKNIILTINLSVDGQYTPSRDVSSFFQMPDRVISVLPRPFL